MKGTSSNFNKSSEVSQNSTVRVQPNYMMGPSPEKQKLKRLNSKMNLRQAHHHHPLHKHMAHLAGFEKEEHIMSILRDYRNYRGVGESAQQ